MTTSARLLQWYRRAGRVLPWRGTRDPYHLLVSEIMLQQTQVPRVLLFYSRWLKAFHTWARLAIASNAEVIHAWAGLGYNRRALILRDIARSVVAHGVPQDEGGWRALKGIGPYTAAALTVFSLHKHATPIDTNIRRVVSRLYLSTPFPDPAQDDALQEIMRTKLMTSRRFYDIPQALFDLATIYCKKTPNCASCPLRPSCKAASLFLQGRVHIPHAMIKKAAETRHKNKPFPDRIYRGRILQHIRTHVRGVLPSTLGPVVDPHFVRDQDEDWILRMVERLTHDQLITKKGTRLFLGEY